jgi:hypothetical protein
MYILEYDVVRTIQAEPRAEATSDRVASGSRASGGSRGSPRNLCRVLAQPRFLLLGRRSKSARGAHAEHHHSPAQA